LLALSPTAFKNSPKNIISFLSPVGDSAYNFLTLSPKAIKFLPPLPTGLKIFYRCG
jgi:hypothetical protein